MDIRQLTTFLHVATLGSLSRAAEHLHIAQPALGRQIKMLEEELSVALFTRHGRGMVLTAEGHTLLERASAILRLMEDARVEISSGRDAVKGTVSLGVPPTAGEVIAGPLVERFIKQHPEVTVRIVPAFSGYLLDMLQRGEVDLAVMYETHAVRELEIEPLIVEPLSLVSLRETKQSARGSAQFAELASQPLILPGPRHGLRVLIEEEARKQGIELTVPVEADSLQTLKDLVLRGLGATVLPVAAIYEEMKSGRLQARPITAPELSRKLVLARSIAKPSSNAVKLFEENLKAETADLVQNGVWKGRLLISTNSVPAV